MQAILATEKLSKRYKGRWAVRELDLSVAKGDIFGFLGPNGAGKTTTIRMMLGLISPDSGTSYINGTDIRKDPVGALRHIGAIVETPSFYGYLSGIENLDILGRVSGGVAPGRVEEVLEMVGLAGRGTDKVRGYSQGMRQRLGIAQALLSGPEIIILDEPTNGLDPSGMVEIRRLINRLARDHGITVFISSHMLHEVEAVCTKVAVINNGVLLTQGAVDDLLKKETLRLDIRVSDKERAAGILSKLEFVLSATVEDGHVEAVARREDSARVNKALVDAGIAVFSLIPRETTLEDFFMELTGGTSGDRSAAGGRRIHV